MIFHFLCLFLSINVIDAENEKNVQNLTGKCVVRNQTLVNCSQPCKSDDDCKNGFCCQIDDKRWCIKMKKLDENTTNTSKTWDLENEISRLAINSNKKPQENDTSSIFISETLTTIMNGLIKEIISSEMSTDSTDKPTGSGIQLKNVKKKKGNKIKAKKVKKKTKKKKTKKKKKKKANAKKKNIKPVEKKVNTKETKTHPEVTEHKQLNPINDPTLDAYLNPKLSPEMIAELKRWEMEERERGPIRIGRSDASVLGELGMEHKVKSGVNGTGTNQSVEVVKVGWNGTGGDEGRNGTVEEDKGVGGSSGKNQTGMELSLGKGKNQTGTEQSLGKGKGQTGIKKSSGKNQTRTEQSSGKNQTRTEQSLGKGKGQTGIKKSSGKNQTGMEQSLGKGKGQTGTEQSSGKNQTGTEQFLGKGKGQTETEQSSGKGQTDGTDQNAGQNEGKDQNVKIEQIPETNSTSKLGQSSMIGQNAKTNQTGEAEKKGEILPESNVYVPGHMEDGEYIESHETFVIGEGKKILKKIIDG